MRQLDAVAVLGAGSWGTALAMLLARNGHRVMLWGRDREAIEAMAAKRCNARYLPGVLFPDGLEPAADLGAVLEQSMLVLLAVPSAAFAEILRAIAPRLMPQSRLLWASKGLETSTGRLLHQVADEIIGAEVPKAVISGPSFAREVAAGLPTAVTVASNNNSFARQAAKALHSEAFRAYTSDDVAGVELGGALKNVLAIAAGISDGLNLGANARVALITRGLKEIMRLGGKIGARRETLMGLSGIGDLVLTCTDDQSRNRRLGLALGRGAGLDAALREIGQTVEGVQTARLALRMARGFEVEMPICEQVCHVLNEGKTPRAAVSALLGRELKPESV